MSTSTIPPLRFDEEILRSKAGRLRRLLAGVAIGIVSGVLAFFAIGLLDRTLAAGTLDDASAVVALGALPVFLLVVTAHEIGHLTAGRLVGFRFVLFLLGPLKVFRHGERVRWAVNTNVHLAGGAAISAPARGEMHDLRRRYRWMVAGGPLASFLLGVTALAAAPALGSTPALRVLVIMIGGLSLGIAIVTLVPNRAGGLASDGARLLLLSARRGAAAEQEAAFMGLGTAALLGHRPRDWEPALVARISAPGEGQTGANAAVMAYAYAMDTGQEAAAAAHLQRALDLLAALPPAQHSALTFEAAFYEAMARADAPAARRWLEALPPSPLFGAHCRLRAEAAVLAAEGRPEEALAKAAEARAALDRSYEAGGAVHFDEDLQAIERRARMVAGDPTLTHSLSR